MGLYFVRIDEKDFGPLPWDGVEAMLLSGRISGKSLCCVEGTQSWIEIRSVFETSEFECQAAGEITGPFKYPDVESALKENLIAESDEIRRKGGNRWLTIKDLRTIMAGNNLSASGLATGSLPTHSVSKKFGPESSHERTKTQSVDLKEKSDEPRKPSFTPSEIRRLKKDKQPVFLSENQESSSPRQLQQWLEKVQTYFKKGTPALGQSEIVSRFKRLHWKWWVGAVFGVVGLALILPLFWPLVWKPSEPEVKLMPVQRVEPKPSDGATTVPTEKVENPTAPIPEPKENVEVKSAPEAVQSETLVDKSQNVVPGPTTPGGTTALVTPPAGVSTTKSPIPDMPDEELPAGPSDRLKARFQAVSWYLESTFEEHIKSRYKNIVDRVVLPPRWVVLDAEKFGVEAQFRGTLSYKGRTIPNVFFQYHYTPQGWLLVESNYSEKVQKASRLRKSQWIHYGTPSDWDALFSLLERNIKDVKPVVPQKEKQRESKARPKSFLSKKDLAVVMERYRKGDRSIGGLLADQIFDHRNKSRVQILKLLARDPPPDAMFRLSDFVRDAKSEKMLKDLAMKALGASKRPEAYSLLKGILENQDAEMAKHAASFISRFGNPEIAPLLRLWIEKFPDQQADHFIFSLSELRDITVKPHVEAVFWKRHELSRGEESVEGVLALARGLAAIDGPSALIAFERAFSTAKEREKIYYMSKFMESNYQPALGKVRDQAVSQSFTKLENYVDLQVSCIRFIELYGDGSDLKLLDEVLEKMKGAFAAPIRQATETAKKTLSARAGVK